MHFKIGIMDPGAVPGTSIKVKKGGGEIGSTCVIKKCVSLGMIPP
ncbi:hypothetical protein CAXC1_30009 [Candidatus Xenohaliotis californiensis]|uniref:Uncharacterized protein n=1 Tax=Candidatus Xenohaliotis californiensis TaxID=84677 RepID=A0ABP0EX48_9RICK|nr:hypothetical protein CAXC1_30009 [Candidatus Xenohaliotis californiensis]